MKLLECVKLLLLAMGASVLAGCPKCPDGQTREVTEYLAFGPVELIPIPAGETVCRVTADGSTQWEKVNISQDGNAVSYATTLLGPGTPNDAGRMDYRVAARTMDDWGGTKSDLWLDCDSAKALENEVLVRYPDLSKTNITNNIATIPWLRVSTDVATAFKTLRTSPPGRHGVCITNTSTKAVKAKLQYYVPQTACLAQKPMPSWPPLEVQCTMPPKPKTCSGQDHDGSLWAVPTTDPLTGCGGLLTVAANTLSEAQSCVQALGGETPSQVCDFEVRLYDNAATVYVYKIAADAAHANQCSRETECSTCTPQVTAQGVCVGPFKAAR